MCRDFVKYTRTEEVEDPALVLLLPPEVHDEEAPAVRLVDAHPQPLVLFGCLLQ